MAEMTAADPSEMHLDFDFVVVGSGFGGSVSALRLVEKGYRVAVIEQGRRWRTEDLPKSNWDLKRWLWAPKIGLRGFYAMRFFRHLVVLHGNAVGGGSIVYGNTLLEPPQRIWSEGKWAGLLDWTTVLTPHYQTARRMLGVSRNPLLGEADLRLKAMADAAGVGDSFYATEVGVYFGNKGDAPGTTHSDPYFGGHGPERTTCVGCGGCMVGCRYGAKNTLDKNYLYLAEQQGARVLAETMVVDIEPLGDSSDGASGYRISTTSMADGSHGERRQFTCSGVVLAASSLGTQELLFKVREKGSLPRISAALGQDVRTNAESLIGIRFPGSEVDLSKGLAIGSGIYLNRQTNIQVTRYPAGSDALSLMSTLLTSGNSGWRRLLAALFKLMMSRPSTAWRILSPKHFARESMILLCMQPIDSSLAMKWKRYPCWPFARCLTTDRSNVPSSIKAANDFTLRAAKSMGGVAISSLAAVLFEIPMTAHCIGGAVMARSAAEGVCDAFCRVFGYRNLYICDGSIISSNLGVNPSLTITALAEHAMSHIPLATTQRWDLTGAEQLPS